MGAFNTDFDGDQMAVHVPLAHASIPRPILILAPHPMLNPPGMDLLPTPGTQDMVWFVLFNKENTRKTPRQEAYSPEEVTIAF